MERVDPDIIEKCREEREEYEESREKRALMNDFH